MTHEDEFIPEPSVPETLEDVARIHEQIARTQDEFADAGDFEPEEFERRVKKSADSHRKAADLIRRNRAHIGGVGEPDRVDAHISVVTLTVLGPFLGSIVGWTAAGFLPPVEGWSGWIGALMVSSFLGGFHYAAWAELTGFIESIPNE